MCAECGNRECTCAKELDGTHKSDFEKLAEAIKSLAGGRKDNDNKQADLTQRSRLPIPRFSDSSPIGFHLFLPLSKKSLLSSSIMKIFEIQLYNRKISSW